MTIRILRAGTLAAAFVATLGFGAHSALARPSEAARCPASSVGACVSTADCKATCQSLGFPITQSICSGRCCFCSI